MESQTVLVKPTGGLKTGNACIVLVSKNHIASYRIASRRIVSASYFVSRGIYCIASLTT